ncbi:MAG: hypothetical protein V4511_05895 [Bacteroidota bacterium]
MKKVILCAAVVSAFSFASCEKERNCTCTTTSTFGGASTTSTSIRTFKDVTKGQAKTLCKGWTETDGNGAVTTADCKLN